MLNKARDDAGRYAQASLKDTNNVVRMVTAGSKVALTLPPVQLFRHHSFRAAPQVRNQSPVASPLT